MKESRKEVQWTPVIIILSMHAGTLYSISRIFYYAHKAIIVLVCVSKGGALGISKSDYMSHELIANGLCAHMQVCGKWEGRYEGE